MRFSIIVPVHNSAATLAETLNSIQTQEFTDYETIIVDDGSADGSAWIVAQHPLSSHLIRLPTSCGPGAARNVGAGLAKGEFLVFLDSDDIWFPWTLATLDAAVHANPSACFVSGNAIRGDMPDALDATSQSELRFTPFQDYFESASGHFWVGVCGVAIQRTSFERAGGFAEWQANCEDTDLWLRLGTEPGFLRIESPPLFFYRQSDTSLTQQAGRIAPGYRNLIDQEQRGAYPGGCECQRSRRILVTRHTRAASLNLLTLGRFREALSLYTATFIWNLSLLRIKFLLGFWGLALIRGVMPKTKE